ncbi:MAG: phosphoribosylformylglycinamidine synthase subunit PurS [Gemmatimonadetes bacterium]|nr:phosphoribosylformylglycinamidine synthase subunit PurS [Gemmatimonadota bacterium]
MEIRVTPRPGLLDPEGKAIQHALESLGYAGLADVRVGKAIGLDMDAASADEARARAEEMGRKLLANPVTEDFEVTIRETGA